MSGAFTDADYERVVRERDEALARVDSQRSQIAFYRTACTARFLPERFGDETIRELIKELTEERDEARAQVDELRGQYQYSVGLSMALEERDQARRERDEWRDKFLALNQTAGEICNACGWAFKIPGEPCRCEVVRERDEARAEVDGMRSQIERLRGVLHIVSLDEYESTSSATEKVHAHARQARVVLNETLAGVTPSDAAHVASLENLFLKACKRAEKWETASKDAYRRGAEAMREACAQWVDHWVSGHVADKLRDMPIPGEP